MRVTPKEKAKVLFYFLLHVIARGYIHLLERDRDSKEEGESISPMGRGPAADFSPFAHPVGVGGIHPHSPGMCSKLLEQNANEGRPGRIQLL